MTRDEVRNAYFNWLCEMVYDDDGPEILSFRKLLIHLHSREFIFSIPKDGNRAEDGISLRYGFACGNPLYYDAESYLDGPCSDLEMMVALAHRCENDIMDDPKIGDRTSQWFWMMVASLGLNSMVDDRYDPYYVDKVLDRFHRREYERDGKGGLFTIRNCDYDLRDVEIWYQLNWFLGTIT